MLKQKIGNSLLFVLVAIAAISIGTLYYRYMILEDYEIIVEFDNNGNLLYLE